MSPGCHRHRDIKPQNILVVGDARDVQLVDFGLAAEIRTTVSRYTQVQLDTSGTRPYMAPEQWKGRGQDARTDQHALALVAYELLAGHLPFESADFEIPNGHADELRQPLYQAMVSRGADSRAKGTLRASRLFSPKVAKGANR